MYSYQLLDCSKGRVGLRVAIEGETWSATVKSSTARWCRRWELSQWSFLFVILLYEYGDEVFTCRTCVVLQFIPSPLNRGYWPSRRSGLLEQLKEADPYINSLIIGVSQSLYFLLAILASFLSSILSPIHWLSKQLFIALTIALFLSSRINLKLIEENKA